MRVGRRRYILIIAIAGGAALALVGAIMLTALQSPASVPGPKGPAYVRVNVSDKTSVYLEFQGSALRAAASIEALKTAEPVKGQVEAGGSKWLPEITLPIPADQLPARVTAVKAIFGLYQGPPVLRPGEVPHVVVHMGICQTNEQKADWRYNVEVTSPIADSATKAPAIQLPNFANVRLIVAGKPAAGSLGVGVRLLAGTTEFLDVRKDGKSVDFQVTVADASGKLAASKTGPLASLGFG